MKKMSLAIKTILGLGFAVCFPIVGETAAPSKINYQGKLTDNAGNPFNGNRNISFSICSAPTRGCSYSDGSRVVPVTNGVFNAMIGEITAIPSNLFDGSEKFVEITVNGAVFSPRQKLVSAPYALAVAAGAVGLTEINRTDLDSRYLDASNLLSGTVPNALLDSSSVTLKGNTVNVANGLVQLNGSNQASIGGGLILNGGTPLKGYLSTSTPVNFGNISAGSSDSKDIPLTGAAVGDVVLIGAPSDADFNELMLYGSVTAINTVTVRCFNPTGGPINPDSKSVRVSVLKH
ncbi:MAG: hypothetical protein IPP35_00150 [Elusimicrobia bacterium]|nr:hypothetical protein [Elusimicrobiota bacterium]